MAAIYKYPFVGREFNLAPSASLIQDQHSRIIRNQTLYALGILLIELLYGKPIEQLGSAEDINCQGTPGVAWCTAVRLIDEDIFSQGGPRYRDVVRRYIRCDFNTQDSKLDSEEF